MTLEEYNDFCGTLKATTHIVQWGDAHVWKVGGKVFAIAGWNEGDLTGVTFKTTPTEFDFLKEMPGLRPAPYLGSRGFTWIQHYKEPGLDDEQLFEQLEDSHRIIASSLSKKKQRELGITDT